MHRFPALVEKRLHWLTTGDGLRAAQSRAPNSYCAQIYLQRWEQGLLFHDIADKRSLSGAVLNARRCAGIDRKITFHSARHSYATEMLGQGVPIAVISTLLGHSGIRTTEIYAKLVDDVLLNVIEHVREI